MSVRVVLVDDQPVVRSGLRMILQAQPDLEVIGEAADGVEAIEVIAASDPDVVLMDIQMPTLDGIETTRRLRASGSRARVLVLTTYALDAYVFDALQAGAAGFLLKTDPPQTIVDGVRTVAAGDALLAPQVTRRIIDTFVARAPAAPQEPPELSRLTERERDVLKELARGLSNAEIGQALFISEGTVKTHVARILDKLGLRDRVQAVVYAYQHGLSG
ncbi:MAG TPA: response regulator transcription factor [Actinomycetes bacterium]|nr:response regulator transcription factor [Actinomycetes bacterium]